MPMLSTRRSLLLDETALERMKRTNQDCEICPCLLVSSSLQGFLRKERHIDSSMSRLLRESVVVGIMVVTTSVFNVRKVVVSCEWRLWVVKNCVNVFTRFWKTCFCSQSETNTEDDGRTSRPQPHKTAPMPPMTRHLTSTAP